MTSISVTTVTFLRLDLAVDCIAGNRERAGCEFGELIWCDQGSSREQVDEASKIIRPDVLIHNSSNLGQPRGFNATFSMCRGDYVCILGDRCILPQGWLKAMHDVIETGVHAVSIYDAVSNWDTATDRQLPGDEQVIAGHRCSPGIAYGCVLFRRHLLEKYGYWREDLGLYGWCDVEWSWRLRANAVRSVVLKDFEKTRVDRPVSVNGVDYRKWRDERIYDPAVMSVIKRVQRNGYPRYVP